MRTVLTLLCLVFMAVVTTMLSLPAIVKVRDAADRMTCSNNLHQLGLAAHAYADANGHFPPATMPHEELPHERRLSWFVGLEPYLEADTLYWQTTKTKGWDAEENRFLAVMNRRHFRCPGFPDRPPVTTLVPSNYIGVAGLGSDAAGLPLEDPRAGFIGYDRRLAPAEIAGHLSTLVAVVETSKPSGAWSAGGPSTVRGLTDDQPYFGMEGQFGGTHRGGTNVLVADGSVRLVRGQVDPQVFRASVTIKGSSKVEAFGDD